MGHGAVCVDGQSVWLVGGLLASEADWEPAPDVSVWDAERKGWNAQPNLATPRYCHATLMLPHGELLVLGGLTQAAGSDGLPGALACLASVERRGADGAWSRCAPLPVAVAEPAVALLSDGRVLACGGYDEDMTAMAAIYDPARDRWERTSPMARPRAGHEATRLDDGSVMVVGGQSEFGGEFLATAELWNPATGAWTSIRGPRFRRSGHTLTRLSDGRLLVAGGLDVDELEGAAEIWSP